MSWWWLSFCDPSKPVGSQFLGVCIVQAEDQRGAIDAAWLHGCNPGGEAILAKLSDPPAEQYRHCLLDRPTALRLAKESW